VWGVWRDDCLWSGLSFMIAGAAGAAAAVIVDRGEPWKAALLAVPVYLAYRTYRLFVGRLANERTLTSGVLAVLSDRVADTQKEYRDTVEVLIETQMAERELASEKDRLSRTLANIAHVQEIHDQALEHERSARASAERANHLKDQFLATVSHELRTPLNAILGWADMLRSGTLEDARHDRACQAIYTSARHQALLVNELLDVARIMSGKLQLECAAVEVSGIVRGALEVIQPAADAKGIGITVDDDLSMCVVYGDATRLQQVTSNLLANAVKFTASGGAVYVRLRCESDAAEIVVADTGQGIPREFLSSVFEPFRQADGSVTRVHDGLGLGLSIVKQLVEAHGGTVSAESEGEGRGARFTVRLPLASVHGEPLHATAADDATAPGELPESVTSLDGISVLVVDDDGESRQVMAAHLESRHATPLMAASAAEALDLLQRQHVDVLLADVAMPGEDGYSLIRRLRALQPLTSASIPAAAVTAFARDEDRQRALEAGFDLHLAKPLDARSVVAAVAKLAGRVHT
jgi:signal transduction histidine kinase/ActR/RegA family two-component response regulator